MLKRNQTICSTRNSLKASTKVSCTSHDHHVPRSTKTLWLKLSARRNETEIRQFRNCFKTVSKLFCFSFISMCGQLYVAYTPHSQASVIYKVFDFLSTSVPVCRWSYLERNELSRHATSAPYPLRVFWQASLGPLHV